MRSETWTNPYRAEEFSYASLGMTKEEYRYFSEQAYQEALKKQQTVDSNYTAHSLRHLKDCIVDLQWHPEGNRSKKVHYVGRILHISPFGVLLAGKDGHTLRFQKKVKNNRVWVRHQWIISHTYPTKHPVTRGKEAPLTDAWYGVGA